jgi:hypothetical protein
LGHDFQTKRDGVNGQESLADTLDPRFLLWMNMHADVCSMVINYPGTPGAGWTRYDKRVFTSSMIEGIFLIILLIMS